MEEDPHNEMSSTNMLHLMPLCHNMSPKTIHKWLFFNLNLESLIQNI